MTVAVYTCSEAETTELGKRIGAVLRQGDVIALCGDLGAGKTRFVQGVAQGMGIDVPVVSPTFSLFIHTKDSDNILQFTVSLKYSLNFSRNSIVFFTNNFR